MPPPSVIIEPRVGGGPIVQLTPCAGVTFTVTMPNATRVFEEEGVRGLEVPGAANGGSLSLHNDGTLEYNSPTAEYSLVLPRGLADELSVVFQGRNGQALEDEIDLEAAEEENPAQPNAGEEENPQGGRKRRSRGSRVKKQTRRAKGKRRNTVRK